MRAIRLLFVVIAALSLVLLGACGGSDGGNSDDAAPATESSGTEEGARGEEGGGGSEIVISAREFAFDPKEISLEANRAYALVLKDVGAIEHDFSIDQPAVKIAATPTQVGRGELDLDAGSYAFYCSVPGHRQAGMEGTLTVS